MCLRFIAKILLFVVNIAFTLLGIALVVIGVLLKLKLRDYLEELKSTITNGNTELIPVDVLPISIDLIAYVIIAFGIIIFLIAFCGCCGAATDSKCLLITYSVFMGILVVLKVVVLVLLLMNSTEIKEETKSFLDETFNDPVNNATFHVFEAAAKCCGTTGPDSYNITYNGTAYVPPTCCGMDLSTISQISVNDISVEDACLKEDAFQVGCTTLIGDMVASFLVDTRNVLIIIIISEGVLLISAGIILMTIDKRRNIR